jgi:hypothetical protein
MTIGDFDTKIKVPGPILISKYHLWLTRQCRKWNTLTTVASEKGQTVDKMLAAGRFETKAS